MTTLTNYSKAKRYAMKCGMGVDLVHDAYIQWFNKTGLNLFLEPEGRVMSVMGWMVRKERGKNTQMWRGANYKRHYIPAVSEYDPTDHSDGVYQPRTEPNQIEYCSYNETMNLFGNLEGFSKKAFDYLSAGYTPIEIKKMENTSCERVRWHVKKFRKMAGIETNGRAFSWGRERSK